MLRFALKGALIGKTIAGYQTEHEVYQRTLPKPTEGIVLRRRIFEAFVPSVMDFFCVR